MDSREVYYDEALPDFFVDYLPHDMSSFLSDNAHWPVTTLVPLMTACHQSRQDPWITELLTRTCFASIAFVHAAKEKPLETNSRDFTNKDISDCLSNAPRMPRKIFVAFEISE